MTFDDLISATITTNELASFIKQNKESLYDLFMWSTDEDLSNQLVKVQNYLAVHRTKLEALEKTEDNLVFLTLLLDCSERLGLISAFQYLYVLLKSENINIGSRLNAAALYLIGVKTGDIYAQKFEQIYELLQTSYQEEEDNSDKVLVTIINYYKKAIKDFEFTPSVAKSIHDDINKVLINDEYSFLNHHLIHDILILPIEHGVTDQIISIKLDQYLRRGTQKGRITEGLLIEENTDYALTLESIEMDPYKIREISVKEYNAHGNSGIYYGLQRGVRILDQEIELATYMYSFGKMHFEKLREAFIELPEQIYSKRINIIDWGCGQGMATMIYLNHCKLNNYECNSETVILIEPSLIALKRGALNVQKFLPNVKMKTVCKLIGDLTDSDISTISGVNLHLFSNILDIDEISINKLTNLIKTSFHGKNYFVIASPYIIPVKKARIDAFVDSFSPLREFELIYSIDQSAGQWKGNWTRTIRLFSVKLTG